MVVVTMQLFPAKDKGRNPKFLGQATIVNDGTGTPLRGNYDAIVFNTLGVPWKKVSVKDFPRRSAPGWELLYRVLGEALGHTKVNTDVKKR